MSPRRIRSGVLRTCPLCALSSWRTRPCSFLRTILHLRDLPELSRILAIDSALFIPDDRRCLLFCFGPDPQLQLYPESDCANPVRLSLSFKFSPDLTPVADILKTVVLHGSGR